ncbi:MAG: response regulator [Thainema sp.]
MAQIANLVSAMKILLVEDDEIFIAAIATSLACQNYTVESVTDGEQGWEYAQATLYDLIVLDINLPGLDGISLCRQLRDADYKGAILLLTAQDDAHSKVIGLDSGADDYVVKPCTTEELTARIRALLRRPRETTAPILQWGTLQLNPSTCQITLADQEITLSPKEYGLLELFLRNPQRIFSNAMLLERLWGFDETPGDETIRTHIKRLRRKLKSAGAEDVIENVYGMGYRLMPPPDQLIAASAESTDAINSADRADQDSNLSTASIAVNEKVEAARAAAIATLSQFSDVIAARLATLQEAAETLQEIGALPSTLHQQAQQAAHKLVGSLGMFGLQEESNLSKKIETCLSQSSVISNPCQLCKWISQLSQNLEAVLIKVNKIPSACQIESGIRINAIFSDCLEQQMISLLVVSTSDELIRALVDIAPKTLQITQVTDLDQAQQQFVHRLAQRPPDVLLLDIVGFANMVPISSFLEKVSEAFPDLLIFILSCQNTFQVRLKLARSCQYTFLSPSVTAQHLLDKMLEKCSCYFPTHYHVLAVDDDLMVLRALEQQLSRWGIQVTALSNPEQLWNTLPQTKPDLVLLDVEMPRIRGIELCRVIRSDCQWDALPIVFLSAQSDCRTLQQVYSSGADDYITKPFEYKALATRLLNKIRRSRLVQRKLIGVSK